MTQAQDLPTAQNIPEFIEWHDGMLLSPEHFFLSALRSEELLHYRLSTSNSFGWGIHPQSMKNGKIKCDRGLLSEGVFFIEGLETIMPDGLIIHHPLEGVSYPEKTRKGFYVNFEEQIKESTDKSITIFLAVPFKEERFKRYQSIEKTIQVDMSSESEEISIPFLRPKASLLALEKKPSEFLSIPLAKILFEDNQYKLQDFTPPLLASSSETYPRMVATEVAGKLRNTANMLASQIENPPKSMTFPRILEIRDYLRSLISGLPKLEAILEYGEPHPFELYTSLMSVIGHMAFLSGKLLPKRISYHHDNLRETFLEIKDCVLDNIEHQIPDYYSIVPFQFSQETFTLTLEEEWLGANYNTNKESTRELIVAVYGAANSLREEVITWIENALIVSQPKLSEIQNMRILGAHRSEFLGNDRLIPQRGAVLFSITATPEFIVAGEKLSIQNDIPKMEGSPAKIVLYVRKK
ncbi:MAG: type VI secretion system protein ImpJ [bacterium]|jgi:type VI secretion system protein ImpJ